MNAQQIRVLVVEDDPAYTGLLQDMLRPVSPFELTAVGRFDEALRQLGCVRVPVYLVHYEDPSITLTTWPRAAVKTVTKEEVVARGTRGDLFPPKTTRHLMPEEQDEVRILLEELR